MQKPLNIRDKNGYDLQYNSGSKIIYFKDERRKFFSICANNFIDYGVS